MLRADFLIDQDPYGQKLYNTTSRYGYKDYKNAEFHYQRLTYNISRLDLRGHLGIFSNYEKCHFYDENIIFTDKTPNKGRGVPFWHIYMERVY